MLANPPAGDWLHWRRTYDGQGFSPLDQINQSNAAKLTVAWAKALPAGSNGITPLVHDGVMFINSAGMVLALDVKSGDTLWRYSYDATVTQAGPPVTQPRSMAAFENLLYVPTLDNHVIALDMKTGKPVWDHLIEKTNGLLRTSTGPIIAKGKLIQGTTGCFDNVPAKRGCFIVGLDARTGTELWRFHTIPYGDEPGANSWNGAPLEERIGGGIWGTGTYDPVNNLVYFGVGQSYHIAPLLGGNIADVKRPALFTDSTLALNPDTGKLVWYYQHMARDVWDLDWSFERTIMDLDWKGSRHHVVATMGKLGILDVLDAKTGKYLFSYDLGMQNLVTSIDPKTGHKTTDPKMEPKAGERVDICPFAIGVRNWPALSYDTARGRLYVPAAYSCMAFEWNKGNKGLDILYSPRPRTDADGNNGRFVAIDVAGQKTSWESSFRAPPVSAVLATAGGVVFNGARDREFRAFDSDTGNILWKMKLDNIPAGSPIAFADGGHEYVAITTGGGHANDVTRSSQTPEVESAAKGTTLWVFELSSR